MADGMVLGQALVPLKLSGRHILKIMLYVFRDYL
jgi:hypothetical protein